MGTYVQVKFSPATINRIMQMVREGEVPNPVDPQDLHCTVIYSETGDHTKVESLGVFSPPIIARPSDLAVFRQRDGLLCLVLQIDCEELHTRHQQLRDEYGLKHSFDEYRPHVTLSYDCGPTYAFTSTLDPWRYLDKLEIVEEIVEKLEVS